VGSAVGGAFAVSAAAVSAIAVVTSSSEGVGAADEHALNVIEMPISKRIFRITLYSHCVVQFTCVLYLIGIRN
jgi:hypothetical protein